jgi:hypothetical protein
MQRLHKVWIGAMLFEVWSQSRLELIFERRCEQREAASGEVTLRLNDGQTIIRAEIVDVSRTGFRICYRGEPPTGNTAVDISYPWDT